MIDTQPKPSVALPAPERDTESIRTVTLSDAEFGLIQESVRQNRAAIAAIVASADLKAEDDVPVSSDSPLGILFNLDALLLELEGV